MATLTTSFSGAQLAAFTTIGVKTSSRPSILKIEAAKHVNKKSTAHHADSRPKKRNPSDRRKGPREFPVQAPAPLMVKIDNGEEYVYTGSKFIVFDLE